MYMFYAPDLADISEARTDCYIRFPHTFAVNFGLRPHFPLDAGLTFGTPPPAARGDNIVI